MNERTVPPLYKYTHAESAILILCDNTIRFTCPLDFNDPMDVRTSIFNGIFNEQALFDAFREKFLNAVMADTYTPVLTNDMVFVEEVKTYRELRIRYRHTCEQMNGKIRWPEYQNILQIMISDDNGIDQLWIDNLKNVRICSLSALHPGDEEEGASSQLMWSHYADKHAGVAIEFNVSKADWPGIFPVEYDKPAPKPITEESFAEFIIGTRESAFADTTDQSNFGTKSKCWEYEEEWRMAKSDIDEEGAYIMDFDPKIVRSIYFGKRCKPEHINRITRLARRHPHIRRLKTDVVPGEFKLRTTELE